MTDDMFCRFWRVIAVYNSLPNGDYRQEIRAHLGEIIATIATMRGIEEGELWKFAYN